MTRRGGLKVKSLATYGWSDGCLFCETYAWIPTFVLNQLFEREIMYMLSSKCAFQRWWWLQDFEFCAWNKFIRGDDDFIRIKISRKKHAETASVYQMFKQQNSQSKVQTFTPLALVLCHGYLPRWTTGIDSLHYDRNQTNMMWSLVEHWFWIESPSKTLLNFTCSDIQSQYGFHMKCHFSTSTSMPTNTNHLLPSYSYRLDLCTNLPCPLGPP